MGKLSRKEFLKQSLIASAGLPLLSGIEGTGEALLQVPSNNHLLETNEDFWKEVREQYTVDDKVINFNNGSVGPQTKQVQDAHIDMYQLSNRAPAHYMWKKVNKKRDRLREELANLMDAETEEVVINRNTTEGLSTVIFGLNLKAGDEVVVSDFDYPFMLNAWRQREMRDRIVLREVKLPLPIEDTALAVDLYRKAIKPNTRVVHITHVQNWTGQVMPVKEITAMAKEKAVKWLWILHMHWLRFRYPSKRSVAIIWPHRCTSGWGHLSVLVHWLSRRRRRQTYGHLWRHMNR
jgi:kynureninase